MPYLPKPLHFLSTLTATLLFSFSPPGETGFSWEISKVKAQVQQPSVGAHRRTPKILSFPVPGETGFFSKISEVKAPLPKTRFLASKQTVEEQNAEADRLLEQGQQYLDAGEYQAALEAYQQAMAIYLQNDNSKLIQADIGMGYAYAYLGETERATQIFTFILNFAQENNLPPLAAIAQEALQFTQNRSESSESSSSSEVSLQAEADRLFNQGKQQIRIGQYQAAIQSWENALTIYQEIDNIYAQGATLDHLGTVYSSLGNYEIAISYYQQALNIAKTIGIPQGEAAVLNNLGNVYRNLGEYETALDFFQRSLAIKEEISDLLGVSNSLNNLGNVYQNLGEYEIAVDYYQRSLAITIKINNRPGISKSLNNLGLVYQHLGDYAKAFDFFQRSLAIKEEISDLLGVSSSLNNLGLVYESLGEYDQAIDYYQRSLAISEEIENQVGVAYSLGGLGNVYERLGEYKEAIDYYQRSLAITIKINNRAGVSKSLNNLGLVYFLSLRQYEKAIDYFQRSLTIAEEIGYRSGIAASLTNLGSVYGSLRESEKAIDFSQRSLTIAEEIGNRAMIARASANLAIEFDIQNKPKLAILFYKQSVNNFEILREKIQGLSTKQQQSYINTIEVIYRRLANLLIQQDRILEAQRVLDLLKIQELEDFLEDVRGNENTKQGIALLPPEQEIWSGYEQIIQDAIKVTPELNRLRQVQPDFRSPEQLQEIARLDTQYKGIVAQLTPFLNSSTVKQTLATLTPATIKRIELEQIAALQNDLQSLDQNAVLLYSVIFDDRLDLILTTPNSPPIRKTVPISKTELNQTILDFRQALTSPYEDALTPAQKLYDLVIKPIEMELKEANADTIIYAPDAQFRYIPLAALHDGEKWLTERFQINHITALALTDLQQKSQPDINILAGAFANGFYQFKEGDTDFRFSGLSGAEAEVQNLGELFPNTTLMDRVFNPDNTVPKMENHSIVHLATHAAFVVGKPEASFILFGDGSRTNLRDVEKEWNLNNVDLVVLSACETGVNGQFGSGQEILGFGYLMQLAGARGSLSSLWEVSDAGTQVLMSAFYDNLQDQSMTKIEALQQAQIALINNDEKFIEEAFRGLGFPNNQRPKLSKTGYSHPYYWSPFILIGNGL